MKKILFFLFTTSPVCLFAQKDSNQTSSERVNIVVNNISVPITPPYQQQIPQHSKVIGSFEGVEILDIDPPQVLKTKDSIILSYSNGIRRAFTKDEYISYLETEIRNQQFRSALNQIRDMLQHLQYARERSSGRQTMPVWRTSDYSDRRDGW